MKRTNFGFKTANEDINDLVADNATSKATINDLVLDNAIFKAAMSGDIVLSISPLTANRVATSEAWTRDVVIKLVNSDGDVHDWLTADYATKLAIADTSSAGTATIESTTLSIVNGQGSVEITGSEHAWLAGVKQAKAISVTNGSNDALGDLIVTVTAVVLGEESPKAVTISVAKDLDENEIAEAIRVGLEEDEDVGAFFTVGGEDAQIILTAKTPAANDATLDIALTDADSTGVTVGASSNAAAGVAPETNTLTVSNLTILGYTVTGGTSVEKIVEA